LEAVFILVEFPSPLRRIFIGSHSLPLSGSPNQFFNRYQNRFRSFLTLTSLKSKDGIPGIGFGSFAFRCEELPDVAEADGGVPPQKGSDPLGRYSDHNLCSSD
jgi:hypothetical protein